VCVRERERERERKRERDSEGVCVCVVTHAHAAEQGTRGVMCQMMQRDDVQGFKTAAKQGKRPSAAAFVTPRCIEV
jgi:hypothetical protein